MKNVLSVVLICFLVGFYSCNGQKPSKKEIDKILENSDIEIKKGNYKTASELLDKIEKSDNNSGNVYIMRSKIAYFEGDYEKALNLAEKALAIMPEKTELLCLKGEIYIKKGNLDSALDNCMKCVDKVKSDTTYFTIALVYKAKNEYEKSLIYIDSAISIRKTDDSYFQKVEIYLLSKEYQKAINECSKSLALYQKEGIFFLLRGIAYYRLGNISKCCEDVHLALPLLEDESNINEAKSIIEKYCK